MLQPADLNVVRRDPALPGLQLILDPDLLGHRLAVKDLHSAYIRYKPSTSCVASLLEGYGSWPFAAAAYPECRFEIIRTRTEWLDGPSSARLLEDACVALVPMTLDRGLKAASSLGSPEKCVRLLRKLIGRRPHEGFDLAMLRYKPGRRIVARLDFSGRTRALIKAYCARDFSPALAGAKAAAASGGARVLGVDTDRLVVAYEWLKGKSACPSLGQLPSNQEFHLIGERLAHVHSRGTRNLRSESRLAEADAAQASVSAYCALKPDDAEDAQRACRSVTEQLACIPLSSSLIHGDFSSDQVVLRRAGPVIIDWDRACVGDPARDIGTFMARLDAQAIDGVLSLADSEAAQAAFLEGYAAQAGALPDSARLHRARSLLLLLPEGFRQRAIDWPQRGQRLLSKADQLLSQAKRRPSKSESGDIPELELALDQNHMTTRLRHLAKGECFSLAQPELFRLKPGTRALVRYRMVQESSSLDLIGKIRAVGLDRRTPALHSALRDAGLDGRRPHRVGVPRSRSRIAELKLWLQDAVPGRMATDFLHPEEPTRASEQAGAALAHLHKTSVTNDRRWSDEDELRVLEKALTNASTALPTQRSRLEALAESARELLSAQSPSESVGIHRDFYPDQILIDDEKTWLLDLDLYNWGDPAIDVGNYLAHIAEYALRRFNDPGALREHSVAFVRAYEEAGGGANRNRVGAMFAVSLARHIHISMRFRDREHTTQPLIELCENLLRGRPSQSLALVEV